MRASALLFLPFASEKMTTFIPTGMEVMKTGITKADPRNPISHKRPAVSRGKRITRIAAIR